MTYNLKFVPSALKEWKKLGSTIQKQFKNKLEERVLRPKITKDKLRGHPNLYKIKLRSVGYRLVYEIDDKTITVLVLAIGKRNRNDVYDSAFERI